MLAAGVMVFALTGCGASEVTTGAPAEDVAEVEADAPAEDTAEAEAGAPAAFAEQIQTVMAAKDMEALADLCSFPLAVDGEAVETKEAFMELGADVIFTEERCAAIKAVDVSALEETMAGIIMGDATPNIIFKSVDGKLGITGIN